MATEPAKLEPESSVINSTKDAEELNVVDEPTTRGYDVNSVDISIDSDDTDSAIDGVGSDVSSTGSFRSSFLESVVENGRTYHRFKAGKYLLPNDEMEQDRLDLQHQMWLLLLEGQLFLAPVNNPQNILDFATGTGIWAMDVAAKFPEASVIGSDLSPIQPNYVPPNCQFEIDDAEEPWVYNTKFDLIHARLIFSCFKNPRSVIQSAFDALKPGGYLEFHDGQLPFKAVDDSIKGTALDRWNNLEVDGGRALGRDFGCLNHFAQWMREIGFVDVFEKHGALPSNTWPKDKHLKTLGAWFNENMMAGMHAMSMAVQTRGLGMTPEEVELGLVGLRKDLKDRSIHSYFPTFIIYGKKPE